MCKTLWICVLIGLASGAAHASLLIEPYGGYSLGNVALQTTATFPVVAMQNYSDSGTISGFAYGGRVGFVFNHFAILAGEYQAMTGKEKFNQTATASNWTQNTTFATLGFQAPRGFRFMGSYGFTFNGSDDTLPTTAYKGSAFKLAIGWLILPKVAINLEYTIYKLKNYTQMNVTNQIADNYSKFDYSAAMVNLSLPLQFHIFDSGGHGSDSKNPSR